METKTINVDGINITVRGETGRDVINRRVLYSKVYIQDDDEDTRQWVDFGRALHQTVEVTGLPFDWPGTHDNAAALTVAREYWLNLPGRVIRAWIDAMDDVDAPPVSEPDLDPKNEIGQHQMLNGESSEPLLTTTLLAEKTLTNSTN